MSQTSNHLEKEGYAKDQTGLENLTEALIKRFEEYDPNSCSLEDLRNDGLTDDVLETVLEKIKEDPELNKRFIKCLKNI